MKWVHLVKSYKDWPMMNSAALQNCTDFLQVGLCFVRMRGINIWQITRHDNSKCCLLVI